MNIVYLTDEFVTEHIYGGLATYLENIVSIMTAKGHTVTVITLSDVDQILKYKNLTTIIRVSRKKVEKPLNDFEKALLLIENSRRVYIALKALLKKEKIDIVQAANYRAVGFFRTYKIPTIVRVSSDSSFLRRANEVKFDYGLAMAEKKWVDQVELFCVKHADSVFAPSKCCADIVEKRSGRKVKVIESPYCCKEIQINDRIFGEKLNGKRYLLFNSSLSMLKGTHLGILAGEQILAKYPDLYMVYAGLDGVMAGTGKKISSLLRQQSKKFNGRVIYLEKLPHECLFPIVENAVACVLPSRIDNLPNSCIEAMVLGKVVIGVYGASFEQLIKNKINGLLIERDSVRALVRAVDYLMQLSEEQYLKMGENAQNTVKRLAPDIIYDNMMEYYRNVLASFRTKNIGDIFNRKNKRG